MNLCRERPRADSRSSEPPAATASMSHCKFYPYVLNVLLPFYVSYSHIGEKIVPEMYHFLSRPSTGVAKLFCCVGQSYGILCTRRVSLLRSLITVVLLKRTQACIGKPSTYCKNPLGKRAPPSETPVKASTCSRGSYIT